MAVSDQVIACAARGDVQQRCRYAFTKAAIAVMTEDVGTADHAARVLYAKDCLLGTADLMAQAYAILSNATIATAVNAQPNGSTITDSDIDFQVGSVFTAFGKTKV